VSLGPEVQRLIRESVERHRYGVATEAAQIAATGVIGERGRPLPPELSTEPEMADEWHRLWERGP